MDPSHLMTQTATLHHVLETGVDDNHDVTTSETTSSSPCLLQQTTRAEQTAGGVISTEVLVLFLPAGTEVDPLTVATIDGIDYEFGGPPWPAFNPRTRAVSHIEATVRRVV